MDANQVPAVSPTGEPYFKPAVLKWVALGFGIASAVLMILGKSHPEIGWLTDARDIVFEVGLLLGIVSPGLRRAQPVLAFVLSVVVSAQLVACTAAQRSAVERYFREVGSCSLGKATDQGKALLSDLDTRTRNGSVDWEAEGRALGFDVLACALEALYNVVQNRWEMQLARQSMNAMPDLELAALDEQLHRIGAGAKYAFARERDK